MDKGAGKCRSDIEDLAFLSCPARESDPVGRRGCIEHVHSKD